MKEEWKDINGYEGFYQVSNLGRVKSLDRYVEQVSRFGNKFKRLIKGRFFKIKKDNKYSQVRLSKNGKECNPLVHILVAQHFIPNPENKTDVHHIDHNKANNCVNNLMWVTVKEHSDLHPERFEKALSIWRKKIKQYDFNGNLIKVWNSGADAAKELGLNKSHITACCKGKKGYIYSGGFIWRYIEDDFNKYETAPKWQKKSVDQLTKDGVLIMTYNTIADAKRSTGIDNISACCRGIIKSAGGYIWRYN